MLIKFFDSASTTKTDDRVLQEMLPYFSEIYGNASSNHDFGKKAKNAIDRARKQVASLINAENDEIIFTSGATESINLALKGFVEANYEKGNHIITVKTEHKAVLSTCEYLETKGIEITYLDVDNSGLINIEELNKSIRKDTLLICVMYVNNETGVIQPIKEVGKIAKENNITFFCDATQAVSKIPVNVEKDNIDMLCFSGHKINGPKGIGILYKKRKIELTPIIHGGGQENGLRGGTYNTPLIVGLGKASEITFSEQNEQNKTLNILNDYISERLLEIDGVSILGHKSKRISNIINTLLPNISSDIFIAKTNSIAMSNGSACTSQIIESSHVLKAMGISEKESKQYVRISFDKNNTTDQINELLEIINIEISSKRNA
jgi:cysteine desulfurase